MWEERLLVRVITTSSPYTRGIGRLYEASHEKTYQLNVSSRFVPVFLWNEGACATLEGTLHHFSYDLLTEHYFVD